MDNQISATLTSNKKIPFKYHPIFILTVIFIAFSLSGYTGEDTNYLMLALFALWVIIAALTDLNSFIRIFKRKTAFAFILYIIFFTVTALFSPDLFQTSKIIGEAFILFSPVIIFIYFSNLEQENLFGKLLIISLIVLFYFCIAALIFYANNENAARVLASNSRAFDNLAIGGGYGLAYGAAILAVYFFDMLLNGVIKRKSYKSLTLISILVLVWLVLDTQSTITILVLLIGLILSYLLKKRRTRTGETLTKRKNQLRISIKQMFKVVIVLLLLLTSLIFYKSIGFWIIEKTADSADIVSIRISEIGYKMAYSGSNYSGSEDLDGRINILKSAFGSFASSPIIGHGYKYGYMFEYGSLYGVGNHCEWIDALATMGLLGGIPFLLIYASAVLEERKYNNNRVSISYIIVLFLLGLLNPFRTFQSHFILFFIIISLSYLIHKYIKQDAGKTELYQKDKLVIGA